MNHPVIFHPVIFCWLCWTILCLSPWARGAEPGPPPDADWQTQAHAARLARQASLDQKS